MLLLVVASEIVIGDCYHLVHLRVLVLHHHLLTCNTLRFLEVGQRGREVALVIAEVPLRRAERPNLLSYCRMFLTVSSSSFSLIVTVKDGDNKVWHHLFIKFVFLTFEVLMILRLSVFPIKSVMSVQIAINIK